MSLVQTENLTKKFPRRGQTRLSLGSHSEYVYAVDSVSLSIKEGETIGLVGESGSGKTTLGLLLAQLEIPSEGKIFFEGRDVSMQNKKALKAYHRNVQMIFQDPYDSLDPRFTIGKSLMEPLTSQGLIQSRAKGVEFALNALEEVGMNPPEKYLERFPHQLSGGQRQRVVIARAMISRPKFVIADEPVSMLDLSLRSSILNIMQNLKAKLGVTYCLITHDLTVARYMCDRVAVMYRGRIVELGPTDEVIESPYHPYTELLLAAVPNPDPTVLRSKERIEKENKELKGLTIERGCRFYPRCSYSQTNCQEVEPKLIELSSGHFAACYYPLGVTKPRV